MSLIITQISKYGIIHATDSNLTAGGLAAGEAKKLFEISFLKAGLTVAGSYLVGSRRIDEWMENFIQAQQDAGCSSLGSFAKLLAGALQREMTSDQKKACGSIIHIAGFVRDGSDFHPEFWFVRNVFGLDQNTGQYGDLRETFDVGEDFWARDWKKYNLSGLFNEDGYWIYINGFAEGRMGYWILQSHMNQFFWQIWGNPSWKFRPPKSIEENRLIVDLYVRTIGVLFSLSDYSAPFIGGTPQTYAIPTR